MRIVLMAFGFIMFSIGVYDVLCPPTPTPTPVVENTPTVVPTNTSVPTATFVEPTATTQSTPTIQFTETITPVISTAVYTTTISTPTSASTQKKGNVATATPNMVMPNTGPFDEIPYMGYFFMVVGCICIIIGSRLTRKGGRLI